MKPLLLFALLPVAAGAQDFGKDVLPIFAANCIGCHATGVKMGGLVLDNLNGVLEGGSHGKAIVPGQPAESRLMQMVTGKIQPAMPMGGKALAAGEIAVIEKWIAGGAKPPADPAMARLAAQPKIPDVKPRVPVKPQIFALAWRPDGKLLALAGYKQVRLVDPAANRSVAVLDGFADGVRAADFSRDGKLFAGAGGLPARKGEVKIWDVDTHTLLRTIEGHDDCIYAVAFSPDGKWLATSSYDKLIKLWDVATGAEVRTLKDHVDAVYALAFTPDGKRLLSGAADRTVKIWDTATGERLYTLGDPTDGINTIALDPAGKRVAAGGLDKTIRIWSLGEKSGTLLVAQIAHEDAILKLAWSPDGKTLISSAADHSIKVLKADDLSEIKALTNQSDWIYGLEFSPDGKTFAAGRFDGSLSIYDSSQYRDVLDRNRAAR